MKQLRDLIENKLVKLIDNIDQEHWLKELDDKDIFRLYRTHKRVIREEQFYDKEEAWLMFRAWTNTL